MKSKIEMLTQEEFMALSDKEKIAELHRLMDYLGMTANEAIDGFKKSRFYNTLH